MITPELIVSEDTLTFARTTPGKPVFMVLHVTADEGDTQVTVSTDLPDVFQLATDSRPLFGPTLTFSPGRSGTYVHIRYQPARTGVHDATLTLESAIGQRIVSLHGRSGRLTSIQSNNSRALTRTVKPQQPAAGVGKLVAGAVGALLLIGLIYGGITYRCQLMPSLCREDTVAGQDEPVRTSKPGPVEAVSEPAPDKSADAALASPKRTKASRKALPDIPTEESDRSDRRGEGQPEVVPVLPDRPAGSDKKLSQPAKSGNKQPVSRPAEPVRPTKTASESEESDLERALNTSNN